MSGIFSAPVPRGRHHDGRRRADDALRRHVNLLGGHGDERAGGERAVVDVGDGRALELADDLDDFLGHIHAPAIGVHVEDERVGLRLHGFLHAAPDHVNQRRHDVLADGQDVNFPGWAGRRGDWFAPRTRSATGQQEPAEQQTESALEIHAAAYRRWPGVTTEKPVSAAPPCAKFAVYAC